MLESLNEEIKRRTLVVRTFAERLASNPRPGRRDA
jgi:hypothetical protein